MAFFSIIIATFNRSSLLEIAINSVLDQSFTDWELIISDDGSTDSTELTVNNFVSDPRISYYFHSNQGVTSARNIGAFMAKGEFLIFLDSDDWVKPSWLSDFHSAWELNKTGKFFQMGYELISASKTLSQTYIPKDGKYNPVLTGTFMIDRPLFVEIGGYDKKLSFGENSELFMRVIFLNSQVILISSAKLVYNESLDGGSKNLNNMSQSIKHTLRKHKSSLNSDITRLYLQIVGVNGLRLGNYPEAKEYLLKAYLINPFKIDTLIRFLISCMPLLSKIVYPIKGNFQNE